VTISLDEQTLSLPDGTKAKFSVDSFSRYCLLNGMDELDFLLAQGDAITAYEQRR
jgi:3-isopropylmalate/(R)-2-methylmalate dehydratase small subunit